MTLNGKLTKAPFSSEDLDLLKMMADQTAGNLLNIQLSEDLLRIKKMEVFQNLSAFFVHDLKNLASTLSLHSETQAQLAELLANLHKGSLAKIPHIDDFFHTSPHEVLAPCGPA